MTQATYDDANLLLRLYEMRREEKMREARAWFVANFKPKSMADIHQLCPPGSESNARMRMVSTYWDMAASFVTAGVLNPDLFFANSREMLLVAIRLRPVLAEIRAAYKDPARTGDHTPQLLDRFHRMGWPKPASARIAAWRRAIGAAG